MHENWIFQSALNVYRTEEAPEWRIAPGLAIDNADYSDWQQSRKTKAMSISARRQPDLAAGALVIVGI